MYVLCISMFFMEHWVSTVHFFHYSFMLHAFLYLELYNSVDSWWEQVFFVFSFFVQIFVSFKTFFHESIWLSSCFIYTFGWFGKNLGLNIILKNLVSLKAALKNNWVPWPTYFHIVGRENLYFFQIPWRPLERKVTYSLRGEGTYLECQITLKTL